MLNNCEKSRSVVIVKPNGIFIIFLVRHNEHVEIREFETQAIIWRVFLVNFILTISNFTSFFGLKTDRAREIRKTDWLKQNFKSKLSLRMYPGHTELKGLVLVWLFHTYLHSRYRVSTQGVKSFGCHFACLFQGLILWSKKNIIFLKKREILLPF